MVLEAIDLQTDDFDPDDMFNGNGDGGKKESSASSDESLTADEVYTAPPVKYAYDAYHRIPLFVRILDLDPAQRLSGRRARDIAPRDV
jgi:hypothetical protein